jgi:hypothetical protein
MENTADDKSEDKWTELVWENLIYEIVDKKCIPLIGPGAFERWINLDSITKTWAEGYHYPYPLEDSSQLPRVSQFLAIQEGDESIPKKTLSRKLRINPPPNFSSPDLQNTIYAVLADLNLPIYITTNYDHLMEDALRSKGKAPSSDFCVWKELKDKELKDSERDPRYTETSYTFNSHSTFSAPNDKRPTPANPLVFHLLGDIDTPRYMVLTEKDYIDFVIYLSKMGDRYTLPHSIRQTLSNSTLLFIGYRLEDISFLIVFEGFIKLMSPLEGKSIAVQVQMSSKIDPEQKKIIRKYLTKFAGDLFKIRIYWGDPDDFLKELRKRWLMVPQ